MKPNKARQPMADLQTAQNRMFPFINDELARFENEGYINLLKNNPSQLNERFSQVENRLFDLLCIPLEKREGWHMGIADSGKRTIEALVNRFCPDGPGKNVLVNTENYVAFNKFSAATALEKQKQVQFEKPFDLRLGQAVTINCDKELDRVRAILEEGHPHTLWLAWNSTSTGVEERVERLVDFRNRAKSRTLIIADAASLRLFTNDWEKMTTERFPDVFFFSLRKQGVPYDGPNDEVNQSKNSGSIIVFNDRARQCTKSIGDPVMHPILNDSGLQGEYMAAEPQKANHIRHLIKLDCVLNHFLSNDREQIKVMDQLRESVRSRILSAFGDGTPLADSGFSLLSDPDAQSYSAYIVKTPEKISAKTVISMLKDNGVHTSASMHPGLDPKRFFRFAFYPGNTPDEVDLLLKQMDKLAV